MASADDQRGPGIPEGVAQAGDLVDQPEFEDEISRLQRARQHAAVAKLGEQGMVERDLQTLLETVATLVAQTLSTDIVAVLQYDIDSGELMLRAGVGWEDGLVGAAVDSDPASYSGYALRGFSPMVVDDIRVDARFAEETNLAARGLFSAVSAVIESGGTRWGVLSAHTSEVGQFGMDEAHFMQSVASVLGAAITRLEGEAELRESRTRLELALAVGGLGTWEWDLQTGRMDLSDATLDLWGVEREQFENPGSYAELVHEDDREAVETALEELIREGGSRRIVHRILRSGTANNELRWLETRGTVVDDERGAHRRLLGVTRDITERRRIDEMRESMLKRERAARAASERSQELFAMLAEVGDTLSRTLDPKLALRDLARIVVPQMADWCVIDLLDPNGEPEQVAVEIADDENEELAEHIREHYDPAALPLWETEVQFGREPLLYRDVTPDALEGASHDAEHRALLEEMGLRSVMLVPLLARGRVLGRMFLATSESKRRYGPNDLRLAEAVAERAAVAVDNARLFNERSTVARTLQRALLPPALPSIEGVELAARYRPAGDGTIIVGDFYDAFLATESAWWIVIGDVCGKGTEAAAITGLLRHSVRAAAPGQLRPSRVLETVNSAVHAQIPDDSFCTAALLRVSTTADGAEVMMSSAGHPLPLVVRAGGEVERIDCQGTLLGPFDQVELQDVDVELGPGDSVVLFTDGVTEARNKQGFFGEGGLRRVLAANRERDAPAMADAVEKAVVEFEDGRTSDDIAIVVVRVRPDA